MSNDLILETSFQQNYKNRHMKQHIEGGTMYITLQGDNSANVLITSIVKEIDSQ